MKFASLMARVSIVSWLVLLPATPTPAVEYDHRWDLISGYKDGMALVMDMFTPKGRTNGACVILVMGGGMYSNPAMSHKAAEDPDVRSLLGAGYVVFSVTHSSQPRYSIDDMVPDIPRAVRFIRHNAKLFGIDPQRIGILGSSSGGQMALLAATAPEPADPRAEDPVDRESSRVQAVVAYFPGTDNLNFGRENTTILEHFHSRGYKGADAAFDFHKWDPEEQHFVQITDPEERKIRFRRTSPITHVSADDPPILLFHGDEDKLVPIQQSDILVARLREVGVPHKLIVIEGEGHGWKNPVENQLAEVLKWFDHYLLGK